LLILRATELVESGHGHNQAVTIALALYVAYNAAATVTSLAVGRLIDRRTPRVGLTLGAAAFAVAYLGLSFDTGSWLQSRAQPIRCPAVMNQGARSCRARCRRTADTKPAADEACGGGQNPEALSPQSVLSRSSNRVSRKHQRHAEDNSRHTDLLVRGFWPLTSGL